MIAAISSLIIALLGVIATVLALMTDELKANKKVKYSLVAIIMVLAVYAFIGSIIFLQQDQNLPLVTTSRSSMAVDATKDWQSTGITVRAGDPLTIRVVGGAWTALREKVNSDAFPELQAVYRTASVWAYINPENPGSGSLSYTCIEYGVPLCPIPTAPVGLLVGRIGAGEPIEIGNANTFNAPNNGILFLRINDGQEEGDIGLQDNSGILAVDIYLLDE